jgi:hypothetical protein
MTETIENNPGIIELLIDIEIESARKELKKFKMPYQPDLIIAKYIRQQHMLLNDLIKELKTVKEKRKFLYLYLKFVDTMRDLIALSNKLEECPDYT